MSRVFEWFKANAILSILWSLFGMAVVGYATYKTFNDVTLINAAVASALGVVFGLPAVAIGAWQWRIGWKDKKDKKDSQNDLR